MNGIGNSSEIILIIKKLQEAIQKETGENFRFEFTINPEGKVVMNARYGFSLKLRDKNQKLIKKNFIGLDMPSVVREFVSLFFDGTEGAITADKNGYQFRVQFHYKNGWVAYNGHVGNYCYSDSLEE